MYLPTGTTTNDYYGADRPGDNLFSESIIAVDIETGQRAWHFQAVHHGLWDYDFPTHPNLLDVTVDGREIKALAQVSKQGFVYAFGRVTGEPIWPIEERPVPQYTNLPDEAPARTQPFPTRPPPFEYQGVEIDDLVDFTPEIRAMAVEAVKDFQLGPLFTPPLRSLDGGVQGTIQRPAIDGGANWGGAGAELVSALTAGGGDGGPRLVARDKATGRMVGSVDLPSGAIGTPMTYLAGDRQYIALTIGGGPRLVALALPERESAP